MKLSVFFLATKNGFVFDMCWKDYLFAKIRLYRLFETIYLFWSLPSPQYRCFFKICSFCSLCFYKSLRHESLITITVILGSTTCILSILNFTTPINTYITSKQVFIKLFLHCSPLIWPHLQRIYYIFNSYSPNTTIQAPLPRLI